MSDSSDIWAHDDESLLQHSHEVRDVALEYTPTTLDEDVVETISVLHDFGKATEWFQAHVRDEDTDSKLKQHSLLGACAAAVILEANGYDSEVCTAGFYSIAKHHSEPDNLTTHSTYTNTAKKNVVLRHERLKKQIENIYTDETRKATANKLLDEAGGDELGIKQVYAYVNNGHLVDLLSDDFTPSSNTYSLVLQYWSVLTFADKTATIGLSHQTGDSIRSEKINRFIRTQLQDGNADSEVQQKLNTKRDEARKTSLKNAEQLADTPVGRITLPTGFGKTLTGLQTALKRAEVNNSRVIYALPFTTVIDQTDELIRKIFDVDTANPEYTIHHHLADTRSKSSDEETYDTQKYRAEMWQSDLVLTTFVQLFESLSGPTNRQSVKLPALQNSVILLDEPQGLTYKWWRLANRLIQLLTEKYNAEVIVMTATQPRLIDEYEYTPDAIDLIPDYPSYFEFLDHHPRVTYEIDDSVQRYISDPSATGLSLLQAATRVRDDDEQSTLAVCNTVQQTQDLGEFISQCGDYTNLNNLLDELTPPQHDLEGTGKMEIDSLINRLKQTRKNHLQEQVNELVTRARGKNIKATLTARLRPVDREVLIGTIKELLSDDETKLTVVSTQLIEAGVDVSFDSVYRDLSPFSSIVQTAGRCNRSFEGETKPVTVWRLESDDDEKQPPCELVYNQTYDLLRPTRKTFEEIGGNLINEYEMVMEGTEAYYRYLHKLEDPGDNELVQALEMGKFSSLREESVIPEHQKTVSVITTKESFSSELVDLYREFISRYEFEKAKIVMDVLMHFTVSVPVEDSFNISIGELTDGLYHLDAAQFESEYQLEFAEGVIPESSVDDLFI